MEKSIVSQLSEILNKEDSSEVVFIDETGNEISLQEAIKNKIKGTIVEKKFSQKEEVSKLLLGKERIVVEDLLEVIDTFEKAVYTLWDGSGYAFKSKNYEYLKDILTKYKVKPINRRESRKA